MTIGRRVFRSSAMRMVAASAADLTVRYGKGTRGTVTGRRPPGRVRPGDQSAQAVGLRRLRPAVDLHRPMTRFPPRPPARPDAVATAAAETHGRPSATPVAGREVPCMEKETENATIIAVAGT